MRETGVINGMTSAGRGRLGYRAEALVLSRKDWPVSKVTGEKGEASWEGGGGKGGQMEAQRSLIRILTFSGKEARSTSQ